MTSKNKERKFKRETAKKHLDTLMEKVRDYNAVPDNPYAFKSIVVYGSYVNEPEKEMISDLDIGFKLVRRYEDNETFHMLDQSAIDMYVFEMPSLGKIEPIYISYQYALKFIKHGCGYVSLHDQDSDAEAVFSKKVMEMDVGKIATESKKKLKKAIDDANALWNW